jgi:anti-sigma28 factor (negative regulator of flagellin synthesis)
MSEINPVGRGEMNGVHANQRAQRAQPQQRAEAGQKNQDQVQVSNHARLLSKMRENPVRTDLVNQVRSEIANGQYETEAKIDTAIDEMRADLS